VQTFSVLMHDEDAVKVSIPCSLVLVLAGLTVAVVVLTTASGGQPVPKQTRREFMRQKLNISKDVLEGLALEQFTSIEKNGRALKRLSEAAEWKISLVPNDSDFALFTIAFQRNADELVKQAKEHDIDGAMLAYLKLTMNCVECHKFIRRSGK
jgi:cytochrome c556